MAIFGGRIDGGGIGPGVDGTGPWLPPLPDDGGVLPLPTKTAATLGDPIPIAWGLVRVQGKPVWFGRGDYNTAEDDATIWTPRANSAGEATGGWGTSRGQCGKVAFALCQAVPGEDPATFVQRMWVPERVTGPISPDHYYLLTGNDAPIEFLPDPSSPWDAIPWAGYALGAGIAFKRTAYARCTLFTLVDGKLPKVYFEVRGRCASAEGPAHPADVLVDLLCNLGPLQASQVDVEHGPDGSTGSSYRVWCTAMGFKVNRVVTERTTIRQLADELLSATWSTAIWTGGKLRIIPLGDTALTANGATYTPPTTAIELDDDEILREGHVVEASRTPAEDTRNCFPVEIASVDSDYETALYEWIDPSDPLRTVNGKARGVLRSDGTRFAWVTAPSIALKLSELLTKRSLTIRNRFRLTLNGSRWCLLEPGDTVGLTHAALGLSNVLCRITSIDEDGGRYVVTCEEAPEASAAVTDVTPQHHDGFDTPAFNPPGPPPTANRTFYADTAPTSGMIEGDLWIDTNDANRLYRYNGTDWTYVGEPAGSGNKTFSQASAPTVGMTAGDLWFDTDDGNKPYRYDGTTWQPVPDSGKNKVFYQAAQPSSAVVGDLWVDTDDGYKMYSWTGSAWQLVQDSASKARVYLQTTAPSTPKTGDIWIDTDAGNKLQVWNGSLWTADTTPNKVFVQTAQPTAVNVGDVWIDTDDSMRMRVWDGTAWQLAADQSASKSKVFFQVGQPASGIATGDIWVDTDDSYKLYVYTGSVWQLAQDAAGASNTASGKNTVFYQAATPTALKAGDIWIDTDDGNKLYVASAVGTGSWVLAQNSAGKNHVFVQAAQPTTGMVAGDVWIDTDDDYALYVYTGSAWVLAQDWKAADAKADTALTLAGSKTKVFYQAAAPSNPAAPNDLKVGDLWYSTDTTTVCVDASCKGHAADANGAPLVGSYAHRGAYWCHRWTGSAWASSETTALVIASEVAAGAIGADKVAANSLRTGDYTFSGTEGTSSEVATRGAKMQNTAGGSGLALLAAPGQTKFGTVTFSDSFYRLLNAIDGTVTAGTVFYRGNNDPTVSGGAPVLYSGTPSSPTSLRIEVYPRGGLYADGSTICAWAIRLRPQALADNLDGLRRLQIDFYRSDGTYIGNRRVPMTDRAYGNLTTQNSDVNCTEIDWSTIFLGENLRNAASPYAFTGYMRIAAINVYGWSGQIDFAPSNTLNALATGTIPNAAAPSTNSGSGEVGGGGCPAPYLRVLLADGREIDAGDLYDGALVAGVNDATREPGVGVVRNPHVIWKPRTLVRLADGREIHFSSDHRTFTAAGLLEVQALRPGDRLIATTGEAIVERIEATGLGPVVSFEVKGTHTYFAEGLLQHNVKDRTW